MYRSTIVSHVAKEDMIKLDMREINCIFIGYFSDYKTYKMNVSITHKVFASIYVIFCECKNMIPKEGEHNVWKLPEYKNQGEYKQVYVE